MRSAPALESTRDGSQPRPSHAAGAQSKRGDVAHCFDPSWEGYAEKRNGAVDGVVSSAPVDYRACDGSGRTRPDATPGDNIPFQGAVMPDKAIETIGNVIGGLIGMTGTGKIPAVDVADLRVMFERNADGTAKIWYVGEGTATGLERGPDAAKLAAADLEKNLNSDPPQEDPNSRGL